MKFIYTRKGMTDTPVYQGQKASTGDIVEFTGTFIDKAMRNPDFEAIQSPKKKVAKKVSKKVSKKRVSRG